eukprot:CAMPEP_0202442000 /NCGR_PEP_ID=MMETSP1360-20130828/1508_1 /ASSEMBLY_ACC=CAM_ASM_000848 /TAXON_ID=515479 /ORGANISM="Licmophora paradoxa, Strain CCMP2313" /LENGTH=196 /DNA_ID=CAMNT_0049057229 /DNA_START=219 /DNA_END=810 /DNA_ORIENTATION=+
MIEEIDTIMENEDQEKTEAIKQIVREMTKQHTARMTTIENIIKKLQPKESKQNKRKNSSQRDTATDYNRAPTIRNNRNNNVRPHQQEEPTDQGQHHPENGQQPETEHKTDPKETTIKQRREINDHRIGQSDLHQRHCEKDGSEKATQITPLPATQEETHPPPAQIDHNGTTTNQNDNVNQEHKSLTHTHPDTTDKN